MRERTDRADRAPVRQAITGCERKNLAHIRASVLVIIACDNATDRIDGKCARQIRGITEISFIIVPPRALMVRRDTDVRVRADEELLRAAQAEWQFGVKYERMIREKFVTQPIVQS